MSWSLYTADIGEIKNEVFCVCVWMKERETWSFAFSGEQKNEGVSGQGFFFSSSTALTKPWPPILVS
jgi:hypothetical protein